MVVCRERVGVVVNDVKVWSSRRPGMRAFDEKYTRLRGRPEHEITSLEFWVWETVVALECVNLEL